MIRVTELCRQYNGTAVLAGLNLELRRKETLVISGPSGAGKTTLLRSIAGLDTDSVGTIEIDEVPMTGGSCKQPPHQRGIGMVFQRPALWPHMSVAAHLDFVASGSRTERREQVAELLRETGLTPLASRRPHQLSSGQARRVALARALATRPHYLLMDEPLTNLDPEAKEQLIELTKTQAAALGAGVLYVTHDEWEAARLGGTRVWLHEGILWLDYDSKVPFP